MLNKLLGVILKWIFKYLEIMKNLSDKVLKIIIFFVLIYLFLKLYCNRFNIKLVFLFWSWKRENEKDF